MSDGVDVAVVGGGVVGMAVAAELAGRGRSVALLEADWRFGAGITSRNSGVVHSGIYYPPQSLKARLSVEGNGLLYAWCERRGVPHRRLGKLVFSPAGQGEDALEDLIRNARGSGASGLVLLSEAETRKLEPDLPPGRALLCRNTGIVDAHALTDSLRVAAIDDGALVFAGARVLGVELAPGGAFSLATSRGPLQADAVVNAAGLYADEVSNLLGGPQVTVYPWRGDYFRWRTDRRFQHLIYPVRPKGAPGLGVHLTLGLDGSFRLGPDVAPAKDKNDLGPADEKAGAFREAAERLFGPWGARDRLVWDGAGIRPKLRAPGEPDERDFVIEEGPAGAWHLFGIESPGLTASLALARHVAAAIG